MNKPTNLLTVEDVITLPEVEAENITAKSLLRTSALAEKFYPAPAPDNRSADVITYVENHFDNEDSPVYGELGAAAIWAALKDIKFNDQDYTHEDDGEQELALVRGVVIVPVDSRTQKWPEDFVKEPLMLTQAGSRQGGWFRNAAGLKVSLPKTPTTLNVRPGTLDEIKAIVQGNLDVRPTEFIRNMGDTITSADTTE